MKSFFLAAISLALVVSSQCSNCHWGPSYWCKSEANAAECGGTQFCKDNVWKQSKEPVAKVNAPQSLECDLCEEVVKIIDDQLQKNSTEDEVKNALLSFCNSTGPLASTCNTFVGDYFDEIWQLLITDGLDPSEVCGKIGLCNSPNRAKAVLKKSKLGNAITCSVCEMVAKEIINLVESNVTETEAEVEIKKVCVYLGGFAGECRSLINDFFPELWEAAVNAVGDPNALCQKINFCSSQVAQANTKVSVRANPLCDLCKLVTTFLKPYVDSNSTENEVKSALENVCKLLPSSVSSECTSLVDTYFDIIWDLVKQEVDSGEICKQLGLCNGTAKMQFVKVQPRPKLSVGNPVCDICQAAVNFLKPYVDSNTTEQQVKDVLNEFCSLLPSAVKDECTSFVKDNFDMVWLLLKAEVDSGAICTQLGLCNSTKTLMKKTKSGSDTLCSTCKTVVSYVRTLVDSSITKTVAEEAVEDLCKKAGPLAGECKDLVDQYFPMIWMLIQSYADDEKICTEIKLCSSAKVVVEVQEPAAPKVSGVFCMVCELVMKEVTHLLVDNTTKQAIEDALDKACGELPSSLSSDCTEFVDKYGSEIIDLILSGTAAKAVCTVLGLCVLEEKEIPVAVQGQGMGECETCKMIVGLAKTLISSNEGSISKALDKVCAVVPSGIEGECKSFIDTYGPQLIELLDKAIEPDFICKEIKLCSAKKQLSMLY